MDAILAAPEAGFTVRALTRDPTSDKAKALEARGAQVAAVDLDDPSSIAAALDGVYGAFVVTFFWAHMDPAKETAHATAVAEAAKAAGVQHVVWSTLEDTRKWVPLEDDRMPTLQGKYKVPHLDSKGEADAAFVESGVPTTFLYAAFYWDNAIMFGMAPRKNEDGSYTLALPIGDKALPGVAASDIGAVAFGIFKGGEKYHGKQIGASGEHLTGEQMAATYAKVFGVEVTYSHLPFDVYRGLGFPGAEDLGNMFQFFHDFSDVHAGLRAVKDSEEAHPGMQTLEAWLVANKDSIPM